jgi:hypothetical protein
VLRVVHRKHQHLCLRSYYIYLPRCFQPIHNWHLQVEEHDFGMQISYFLNSHRAVFSFAAAIPIGVFLDGGAYQSANRRIVIDNENGVWQKSIPFCPRQAAGRNPNSYRQTVGAWEGQL